MKQDFTIWRNQILQNPRDISPLKFGISQDEVIEIFGNPDAVSTMRSDGKPLILKYHDIELHFDRKAPHGLYLVRWTMSFSFKMEPFISLAYMKTAC